MEDYISHFIKEDDRVDYIISFSVFVQSFLVILQQVMIMALGMEAESTTKYRVILTAIPMSISIILSFYREPKLFIKTYFWSVLIVLLNISLCTNNSSYLESGLRFLLPIVIPSALCLMTVRDIRYIEKTLLYISCATFALIVFFIIKFLTGGFSITDYSMPFAYGCLIPMTILYRKKTWISLFMSLIILFVVLAFGCRGPAIVFIMYVMYDILAYTRKYLIPLILILVSFIYFFPNIVLLLDSTGTSSRTLSMLEEGNLLTYNSGRDNFYSNIIDKILDNPFGLGLFADRYFLSGTYCHNLILEVLINWGIILGGFFIIIFFVYLIKTYLTLNNMNKNRLLCYFLILCLPLMFTGSYLTSYDFGSFLGMFYLIAKDEKFADVDAF